MSFAPNSLFYIIKETSQQVAKMLKIEEKRQVASIFWKQLLHDMKLLSLAVGHNMDETCLILHMVLKKILNESQKNGNSFQLTLKLSLISLSQS